MRKSTRQADKRAAKSRLSGGIPSIEESPKNKKIVFGDVDLDVNVDVDAQSSNNDDIIQQQVENGDRVIENVGINEKDKCNSDRDDDDDAVEEVKGSSARESSQRLREEERKVARESSSISKKKRKKRTAALEEEEEELVEEEADGSSESEGDDDDDDMLTDAFFQMVDSERATQLQKSKQEKKNKKIQQKKRLGKHTTFVVEDEYKLGGDVPHRIDQTNIEVVPIGGGGVDASTESSSNNNNNAVDDEERQLLISATLGCDPSKTATLFARGSMACGTSKERGSESRKRKSKNEGTWKRSKKLNRLGTRPGQAATLFVCKKKKKR